MSLQTLVKKIHEASEHEMSKLEKERKELEQRRKEAHDQKRAQASEDIGKQIEAKKKLLRGRTELLASQKRKAAMTQLKRRAIDEAFTEALAHLRGGDRRAKAEMSLRATLEKLDGKLEPSENGGFTLHGGTYDVDATFESIVERELKSGLLPELSHLLFS